MKVTCLHGEEAIAYAIANNLKLCRYRDKTGPAKDNLTVEQAREIAQRDPTLIYLDIIDGITPV
jgi:hypothetical protein